MSKKAKAATTKRSNGNPKPEPTKCLCGCNQNAAPKRNFKQGHDAKLRHKAKATLDGKEKFTFSDEQLSFLKKAGYITANGAAQLT